MSGLPAAFALILAITLAAVGALILLIVLIANLVSKVEDTNDEQSN
jgi:hypothetical protein